jgi:hypothetical protein
VPFQRFVGIFELLFAGYFTEVLGDAQRAFVANHDGLAADAKFVLTGEIPAHSAGSHSDVLADLTRYRQWMSGREDPLSCVPEQGFGDVPRIRAAHGFALIFGEGHDLNGGRPSLAENRSDKVDHEIDRTEVVAVKDELKVIGLGANIMHRNNSLKREE